MGGHFAVDCIFTRSSQSDGLRLLKPRQAFGRVDRDGFQIPKSQRQANRQFHMFDSSTKRIGAVWAAILFLMIFASRLVEAGQNITLAWDPSPSTSIAGYCICYGDDGTNFQYVVNVGTNTSYEVSGLQEGQTYTFAVIAYTSQGLGSPPSNLITYIVPGLVGISLSIDFQPGGLQANQTNTVAVAAEMGQRVESLTPNLISSKIPDSLNTTDMASPERPRALGGPVISFPVAPGHTYQLQASVDLTTWSTLWQNTATNNAWEQFEDVEAIKLNQRFYRVEWQ
jgi:hypothetical protein